MRGWYQILAAGCQHIVDFKSSLYPLSREYSFAE